MMDLQVRHVDEVAVLIASEQRQNGGPTRPQSFAHHRRHRITTTTTTTTGLLLFLLELLELLVSFITTSILSCNNQPKFILS